VHNGVAGKHFGVQWFGWAS